jgi:NAD(P)-dependent dehydrogenase (short-subunit alcohol dehydrogenase family)
MSQDVAAQAGPCGIRLNCLAPETILTERNLGTVTIDRMNAIILKAVAIFRRPRTAVQNFRVFHRFFLIECRFLPGPNV